MRLWSEKIAALGMLLAASIAPVAARPQDGQQPAQQPTQQPAPCMPGMNMPGCPGSAPRPDAPAQTSAAPANPMQMGKTGLLTMPGMPGMEPQTLAQAIAHHATSGTDAEPVSTPAPMLMTTKAGWMLMFHANVFVTGQLQTGPRGGDGAFSTNWFMPMAQRELGSGVLTLRTMLSLEPATITGEQYPLLFQQGETAYGKPIADGQHPHNLFMEIAALYDWKLSKKALVSFYLAPVGDPALGPAAYPHRSSASEDPLAPIGHHQEDSTHISADVVTVGFTYGIARLEASGFHGREPGEDRWEIEQGSIDSWSTRLTLEPGRNWSGQFSYGRIHSPEALFPSEDQQRLTASLMYNRPIRNGNWANTFVWGRTQSLPGGDIEDSCLLESTLRFRTRNHVWTRIEDANRTNLLILGENPLPLGFQEKSIGYVQAYSFGYDRDFDLVPHLASALGAQFTAYGVPDVLQPIYSSNPVGLSLFLRLRPFSGSER